MTTKFFNRFYSEQRGSVVVMTAILMFVLIGFSAFVLDLGVYYIEGSKLQNSLDSAVLAAVQELPSDNTNSSSWIAAENDAISYAALNNLLITLDDIEPIYKDNVSTNKIIGIKATQSIVVDYNFAKVLGINSGTVTRSSSAGLSPAGAVIGAVPIGVTASSLSSAIAADAVTGMIIKNTSIITDIGIDGATAKGWFGALQYPGFSGASDYSYLLGNGYSSPIYTGQVLEMETGNMPGPTLEGFTIRYSQCTDGCTVDNYLPDCPKLVYLPIVEIVSSSQVRIVSFAAFFLLECGGTGHDAYIKATYLKDIALPNSAAGTSSQDFGLYVCKLLD